MTGMESRAVGLHEKGWRVAWVAQVKSLDAILDKKNISSIIHIIHVY